MSDFCKLGSFIARADERNAFAIRCAETSCLVGRHTFVAMSIAAYLWLAPGFIEIDIPVPRHTGGMDIFAYFDTR
jgi:hypothetical protein